MCVYVSVLHSVLTIVKQLACCLNKGRGEIEEEGEKSEEKKKKKKKKKKERRRQTTTTQNVPLLHSPSWASYGGTVACVYVSRSAVCLHMC